LRWPRDTIYPQKLALTSPICGGRSIDKVRLWTKVTEFVFVWLFIVITINHNAVANSQSTINCNTH
jgi:hypothetical protein